MNEDIVFLQDYKDLLTRLTVIFDAYRPEDLRDMLFFLIEFQKRYPLPRNTEIYITELEVSSLEVTSDKAVAETLVRGVDKYIKLNLSNKLVPPIIVVKNELRSIIVYGEIFAIESYVRGLPVKSVVFDVGKKDPFKVLNLGNWEAKFLIALIEHSRKD